MLSASTEKYSGLVTVLRQLTTLLLNPVKILPQSVFANIQNFTNVTPGEAIA